MYSYGVFSTPFSLLVRHSHYRYVRHAVCPVCMSHTSTRVALSTSSIHLATSRRSYLASTFVPAVTNEAYLVPAILFPIRLHPTQYPKNGQDLQLKRSCLDTNSIFFFTEPLIFSRHFCILNILSSRFLSICFFFINRYYL